MPSHTPREDSIYENLKSGRGEFGKNPRKPFPVPALWTYSFGTGTYTLRRRRRHFAMIACDGGWRKRKRERKREKEKRKTRPPSFKLPGRRLGMNAKATNGGRERRRKPTVGWLVARLRPFSRFSRLDSDDSNLRHRFTEEPSTSIKKERQETSFSPPLATLIPQFFSFKQKTKKNSRST